MIEEIVERYFLVKFCERCYAYLKLQFSLQAEL